MVASITVLSDNSKETGFDFANRSGTKKSKSAAKSKPGTPTSGKVAVKPAVIPSTPETMPSFAHVLDSVKTKNKGVLATKKPCMEALESAEHATLSYILALKQGQLEHNKPPVGLPLQVLDVLKHAERSLTPA